MREIDSAMGLLSPGQTALVIFTKGKGLIENHDGTGSSGWWAINPKRKVDLVIVCKRGNKGATDNEVFIGKHDGVEGPIRLPGHRKPRYIVRLHDFKLVGNTSSNWRTFAQTHQGPIRYTSKTAR